MANGGSLSINALVFDNAMVCMGDCLAASEGLDDPVIRTGRRIAYQEYNTKSPLNSLAAYMDSAERESSSH